MAGQYAQPEDIRQSIRTDPTLYGEGQKEAWEGQDEHTRIAGDELRSLSKAAGPNAKFVGVEAAERESPTSDAFRRLNVHVDELDGGIRELLRRVEPALGPGSPRENLESSDKRAPTSQIVAGIDSVTLKVQELRDVVDSLIRRIEL